MSFIADMDSVFLNEKPSSLPHSQQNSIEPKKVDNSVETPTDKHNLTMILGIFLLILAISGNFVAEAMGCQMQKVLSENMYAKHAVILMIIYFSLGYASDTESVIPTDTMKNAFYIWLFFLMFNKMDIYFSAIVGTILFSILICKDYIDYYTKQEPKKNKDIIDKLLRAVTTLYHMASIITIVGFALYFKRQHAEHYGSFSYITFLLGTSKCASM